MRPFAYATASLMQNCAGAERRRGLADAVLVHEVLRELEPVVDRAEHRVDAGTRTSRIVTSAWSVGMLNVHQKKSTLKPAASVGTRNAVMPTGEPGSPDVRANTMSCVAWCSPELNRFVPLMHPLVAVGDGGRLEVRRVGAVVRLGEPEREPAGAVEEARASTRRAARRCRSRASSARSGSCRRSSSRSAGRCAARGPSSRGARG